MASYSYANKTAFLDAANADTIVGNSGNDSLIFSAAVALLDSDFAPPRLNAARVNANTKIERLHLSDSASQVVLGSDAASFGIVSVFGGIGNDSINLSAYSSATTLSGGSGNDTLWGGSGNDSIDGGVGNDSLHGGAGNDIIIGGGGLDRLDGGTGADSLVGGAGNDTYYVEDAGDEVVELTGEGTDWVISSLANYTLVDYAERLLLNNGATNGTGNSLANSLIGNSDNNSLVGNEGNDTIRGQDGNDTILGGTGNDSLLGENGNDWMEGGDGNDSFQGGAGNDTLDGGAGDDSMVGGDGDDLYYIDSTADRASETELTGGTDTLFVNFEYYRMDLRAATGVENAVLLNSIKRIRGNSIDNSIVGNSESNTLDGFLGADTLVGLTGNDYYLVDNVADRTIEATGQGTDSVNASVDSYTLEDNLEWLILFEDPSVISGLGNSLDNYLLGNSSNNSLVAYAGNDSLDGGSGNDTLVGGLGNDYYYADSSLDIVSEYFGEGMDTVESSATFTLSGNCEVLTLSGLGFIDAFGNALDNTIFGNIRNNSIDGGAGIDSMVGGAGNDTYFVENSSDTIYEILSQGTDWVVSSLTNYTLPDQVERLLLNTGALNGTGNSLSNSLVGNSSNNSLFGGDGNDTILGQDGNDTLVGDNGNDSLLGEGGNDWLDGGDGDDTFEGGDGNDTLNGGAGNDSMIGGNGDDLYYIDSTSDRVSETELTGGTDTLFVNFEYYRMDLRAATGVENAVLLNSIKRIRGNSIDNSIVGNSESNTLDGFLGADTLVGLTGNDYYFVDNVADRTIEATGQGMDSVNASVDSYTLEDNLEWLILFEDPSVISGLGNSLDNYLLGNSSNNTLWGFSGDDTINGGTGDDSLIGGTGNDYYITNSISDNVFEGSGAGTDTVESATTHTLSGNIEVLILSGASVINSYGNSLANSLFGNSRNNTIDGGSGADTMVGANGADYYIVDNLNDVIIEDLGAGTGIDSVYANFSGYSLANNVEWLILGPNANSASGNSIRNTLIGGSGWNSLYGGEGDDSLIGGGGKDTINGGAGVDTMIGGSGNDYFVIDNIGDSIVGGGGSDGIITEIEGYTLQTGFYALALGNGVASGTGNALNNSLTGNSLNNTLNGGGGADTLMGGIGNDYYYINSVDDVVIELSGRGTDTIEVSGIASYTLAANTERLVLGAGAVNGTGTSLNNTLTGNTANNSLFGAAGNDSLFGSDGADTLVGTNASVRYEIDTLTGGLGADLFILGNSSGIFYNDAYNSQTGTTDYALITDFNSGEDSLQLKSGTYYFGAASGGYQNLFFDTIITTYQDEVIARFQGTAFATTSFSNPSGLAGLSVTWV